MTAGELHRCFVGLCKGWQGQLEDRAIGLNAEGRRHHVEALLVVAIENLSRIIGPLAVARNLEAAAAVIRREATGVGTRH